MEFYRFLDMLTVIFSLLAGICMFVFPPKFGNTFFYGASTKWTLKNETIWAAGQKLFAISLFIIGLIFLVIGALNMSENIRSGSVILFIVLLILSQYFVHKILERRYPSV